MLLGAVSIQRRIDEAKAERDMTKTCAVCGGIVGKGRVKYCSEACAKDGERQAMARYMVVYRRREGNGIVTHCEFCGAETTRGMYCSRECELKQQRAVFGSTLRERGA